MVWPSGDTPYNLHTAKIEVGHTNMRCIMYQEDVQLHNIGGLCKVMELAGGCVINGATLYSYYSYYSPQKWFQGVGWLSLYQLETLSP